jgi:tetratricopeptide (TPR) repeat protein
VVRSLYGPGNPEVLNQEMAIGWGLNDRGHYRDADTLLTRAIADYRAAGGVESQALSDALDILGTTRKRLDRPAEAESLYRQSLGLQIRLTGPSDTITASRLSDLGSLLAAQNRLSPAESALVAAQAHRRGVLSPLDVRYLVGESSLATILMKRGNFAEAEPRLRTAVAGLEQVENPGGLNLARALDRWALLQALELRTAGAIVTGRRALAMFDTTMGDQHPETFNSRSALAAYQAEVGDLKAAETDARSAYAGLRLKMGDNHDWTLSAGQRLASIQFESGQNREAGSTATAVLSAVRGKYGRVPPAFAGLLGTAAAVRGRSDDTAGVGLEFRAALAALEGGTRLDSAAYPRVVARYGDDLLRRGEGEAAEPLLRSALRFLPGEADSSAVIVAELEGELGRSLLQQRKYPAADTVLRASVARFRRGRFGIAAQRMAERDLADARQAVAAAAH